ncbi:MAG: hypothetical protein JJU48_03480 [Methylophaga sp.]|nr:hypothetical protein [Methylophaga sp.]
MKIIRTLTDICLLRAGPEDLPASPVLFRALLALYFVVGLVVNQLQSKLHDSVLLTGVELILMMVVVAILLHFRRLNTRYQQTISAMAGTGVLFGILAWPLLSVIAGSETDFDVSPIIMTLLAVLLIWSLLVTAHIFRRALDIGPGQAVIITVVYTTGMLIVAAMVMSGITS